jgi:hypothetical protein
LLHFVRNDAWLCSKDHSNIPAKAIPHLETALLSSSARHRFVIKLSKILQVKLPNDFGDCAVVGIPFALQPPKKRLLLRNAPGGHNCRPNCMAKG